MGEEAPGPEAKTKRDEEKHEMKTIQRVCKIEEVNCGNNIFNISYTVCPRCRYIIYSDRHLGEGASALCPKCNADIQMRAYDVLYTFLVKDDYVEGDEVGR